MLQKTNTCFERYHIVKLLQEPSSVEKIMEIDDHIGCAMSGLIADARTLVEHARVETQVLKDYNHCAS